MCFLTGLKSALRRVGLIVQGHSVSFQQGVAADPIRKEIDLDLVSLGHGSPVAILGFESRKRQQNNHGIEFDIEIIEKLIRGLDRVQRSSPSDDLPIGYDVGVLEAWNVAGRVFSHGIEEVHLSLSRPEENTRTSLTPDGHRRVKECIDSIQIRQQSLETVEGTLLMADFEEHQRICRVHPPTGRPIQCRFGDTQEKIVIQNLKRDVRVVGLLTRRTSVRRETRLEIHSIEPLARKIECGSDLSHPITRKKFGKSTTIEELARQQNVKPIEDITSLFGTWPGEIDDGFEEAIEELRRGGSAAHED